MNINPAALSRSIESIAPSPLQTEQGPAGFGETLKQALEATNNVQIAADQNAQGLHTGQAQGLHEVMIGMEKADISMRLLVTMRNKMIDAYQEIMRMQI